MILSKRFNIFITLIALVLLTSCQSSPETFYQNDLIGVDESSVYLSIEDQPDGTGRSQLTIELACNESISLFSLLREQSSGDALSSMEVIWKTSGSSVTVLDNLASAVIIKASEIGQATLYASYNDESGIAISAQVDVNVSGHCGLPVSSTNSILASDAVADKNGHVEKLESGGLTFAISNHAQVTQKQDEDGFTYLEFKGSGSLSSNENIAISGNQERTVITVALPRDFGNEFDPYHPPAKKFPVMAGFGEKSENRSVYDLSFYGNGEFFTNFFGPTAGYDDTYTYDSPEADGDEIQIFTSRYRHVANQYYGVASSYIDGELGNEVWTRLNTGEGKLYLGRGGYSDNRFTKNFKGRIYEVLIFDRALSDSELEDVHTYLEEKYDI